MLGRRQDREPRPSSLLWSGRSSAAAKGHLSVIIRAAQIGQTRSLVVPKWPARSGRSRPGVSYSSVMPINIYRVTPEGQKNEPVAWLCDDEWRLTPQSEALSAWLCTDAAKLEPGRYVANIGFCWRRDASSGGPAFASETLRRMGDLGMSLYISEYAGFADELRHERGSEALERTRDP